MTSRANAETGVNRLLDIVVEEVSLVDRAANKQRFLIVKRSNDMDETTTDAAATAADETEDVQDLAADAGEGDAVTDANDAEGSGGDASPLGSALAALEGLTEAVEVLATAGVEAAAPRLAELAVELGAVAEQLARLAGTVTPAPDTADPVGGDGQAQDDAGGDPLAVATASIRETLARAAAAIDAAGKDRVAGTGVSTETGDDAGTGGDTAGLTARLGALVAELRTLTGTVREQQQRLARLEKRFGLPNSTPSGERPAKPDDEDIGWPLDLNRPFDRESVDKATSFHDV